jgi:hypothetical protein
MSFIYDNEGRILEFYTYHDHPVNKKKFRKNPIGEDCYLLPDGNVVRDEDTIIALQRNWKEIVYAPGGRMYQKALERWEQLKK